jgi:hypothetical protein
MGDPVLLGSVTRYKVGYFFYSSPSVNLEGLDESNIPEYPKAYFFIYGIQRFWKF